MGALYFVLLVVFLVAVAECLAEATSGTKDVYCDILTHSLGSFQPTMTGEKWQLGRFCLQEWELVVWCDG